VQVFPVKMVALVFQQIISPVFHASVQVVILVTLVNQILAFQIHVKTVLFVHHFRLLIFHVHVRVRLLATLVHAQPDILAINVKLICVSLIHVKTVLYAIHYL